MYNSLLVKRPFEGSLPKVNVDFCPKLLKEHKECYLNVCEEQRLKEIEEQEQQGQVPAPGTLIISHQRRIEILHLYTTHSMSIKEIAFQLYMTYSTVRSIIHAYREHGRTNKLLTHNAKFSLLRHHKNHRKFQKGYKTFLNE